MALQALPAVKVIPKVIALAGGLDRLSTAIMARPGSSQHSLNYEAVFGGGYQRVGGIERFDGRPRPSDATYITLGAATPPLNITAGDTVTGATSGATGRCIYAEAAYVALTRVTGTFTLGETLNVGGTGRGAYAEGSYDLTADQDNTLSALAAASYRADIAAVPGTGNLRGVASLKGVLYAWRDNGAAMGLYKSTASGWTAVALNEQVQFANANTSLGEGDTLTQGGVTATVLRVAVESGTLASGTNTGKLIISGRMGGNYAAGAATSTGAGALTLVGVQTAIALLAGGRVQTDQFNFTASTDTLRLYGCDGVNPEFEFDGTVLVPLNTGMSVRATAVVCHKNHAMFGFRGSLQHSGIMTPYAFTAVTGAAELGTGDTITGFVPVSGSEDRAALLVLCQDSSWVLFGNSGANWQFTPLSRQAGATAYSAQDAGLPMVHDTPGFRSYKTSQAFGNFEWDIESRLIDPLAQNKTPVCSVFSKAVSRYRVFFSDGTAVSATPGAKGWEWSQIDYGRTITVAWSGEVNGVTRTFYGASDGFVYEADRGRSFDGDTITAVLKLHSLDQGQPVTEKTYRYGVLEAIAEGAFGLQISADFNDADSDIDLVVPDTIRLYGSGALFDSSLWDRAYWDTKRLDRKRVAIEGVGYNVAPIFVSSSAVELPHQIKTLTLLYTPRRVSRS